MTGFTEYKPYVAFLFFCGLLACDGPTDNSTPETIEAIGERYVNVQFEGHDKVAIIRDGLILIEEDIVVGEAPEDPKIITKGVHISSQIRQWTGGIVPYSFHESLSKSHQAAIQAAMDTWSSHVPGLRFKPRARDTHYITFKLSPNSCNSWVGRIGGQQFINLTEACLSSFSVHHEIGHAIGLYHEHTRNDQATSGAIQINWQNIRGCLDTARGPEDCGFAVCQDAPRECQCSTDYGCRVYENFLSSNLTTNTFEHDFDSIMHYPPTAAAKSNSDETITVLAINPKTERPFEIGQRTHLSEGDMNAANAMYPKLVIQSTIYANTGEQEICVLEGRRYDANTIFSVIISDVPEAAIENNKVDTAQLTENRTYSVTCTAYTLFWQSNYPYPANIQTLTATAIMSSISRDDYSATAEVRVLSPGLEFRDTP